MGSSCHGMGAKEVEQLIDGWKWHYCVFMNVETTVEHAAFVAIAKPSCHTAIDSFGCKKSIIYPGFS